MQEYKTKIYLGGCRTKKEQKKAVEAAFLNGFQSVSAQFPVTSLEEGIEAADLWEEWRRWRPVDHENIPEDYTTALDHAHPVPELYSNREKGLESLFSPGLFLEDENCDMLPDRLKLRIVLPENCPLHTLSAACNIAFRFGMETTAYGGKLVVFENEPEAKEGNLLVFQDSEEPGISLCEKHDGWTVRVEGQGEALVEFVSYLCEHFPDLSAFERWEDRLKWMEDSFRMKNLHGQAAYLQTLKNRGELPEEAFVSPEIESQRERMERVFAGISFSNYKGMKSGYVREYDIPWEADVFRDTVLEKVCPKVNPGDKVAITGALSEEKSVRDKLAVELTKELTHRGAHVEKVQILCAYKQGFSWIEEEVLPELAGAEVSRIEVGFAPFLPEGESEWKDENGATPSYNNVSGEDPEHWYDLPIRYLQELYPVEDVIMKALSLERGQVQFKALKDAPDITYELRAFDKDGGLLYMGSYRAACSERPYLDDYPGLGKVHPSTGFLEASVNGQTAERLRIMTDVEKIWQIYQEQVLPKIRSYVEQVTAGNPRADRQPFFSRLELFIEASEPDYRLKSREDIISSLDALHEDLYFAGADYFKNYGLERTGEMLDAPGLILPVVRKKEGKPRFRVTLYEQERESPQFVLNGKTVHFHDKDTGGRLSLAAIKKIHGTWHYIIQTEGIEEELLRAYVQLLRDKVLTFGGAKDHEFVLEIRPERGNCGSDRERDFSEFRVRIEPAEEEDKTLDICSVDMKEGEVIGYDQYMEVIGQLRKVPGIAVYRTAVSYAGREIYAIELLPEEEGYVSRTKRITNLPSEIINARHHANEVSSTNAAFMLLRKLLTDRQYAGLPKKLNLVIVPMENVDGCAIHYELQKDNPSWKLHVARFNAIGKEFYYEHFKEETIHTEAEGLTRLYHTFIPDVIVDNHGVPSHEWEQQFSGYTSPSYKGFWLPRSLLYGYFWTVKEEVYRSNYPVNKKMEDVIADAIAKDEEMVLWNKEWAAQFEKYAHTWLPKLFPADYYKDMINYWIPFDYDPAHRYPSVRFPWITTVSYTSEVADETAQGKYLYLCARAHVTHDLAVIDMLSGAKHIYREAFDLSEQNMRIERTRLRPLIV